MKKVVVKIPKEVMAEILEFYDDIESQNDIFAVAEVMRMMGQDDMMAEADEDAERFYVILYRLLRILKAVAKLQTAASNQKISVLEKQIARLAKGKRRHK